MLVKDSIILSAILSPVILVKKQNQVVLRALLASIGSSNGRFLKKQQAHSFSMWCDFICTDCKMG